MTRDRERGTLLASILEWLLMAAFVIYFAALSLAKHAAFETHGFDLGNYDQTVWNTLHGRPFACTNWPLFGQSRLAYHVEPILLLIAPLYLLHEGPETLLVLQALVAGLGAWPVARIARERLGNPWTGPLFAGVYLLFPALQAGPAFEFHAVTLAPAFLGMAMLAIERRRYGSAIPWLVLAASCKEEICLLAAMIGLCVAFVRRQPKLGLILMGVSLLWFAGCMQAILPYFNAGGESAHLGRYGHLGESVPDILLGLARHPEQILDTLSDPARLAYLWRMPLPTGYLSLLAPEVLLLTLPALAINLLSLFPSMYALDLAHYSVVVVPFVVVAAIHGVDRLLSISSRFLSEVDRGFLLFVVAGYLTFTSLFYHRVFGQTPLAKSFRWPQITQHHLIGHDLLSTLPESAAVAAQSSLNPHVSQRAQVYVFPEHENADYVVLDVTASHDLSFELASETSESHPEGGTYSGDPSLTHTEYQHLVQDLLGGDRFGVSDGLDGYLILKKGARGNAIPKQFSSPFLGEDAAIAERLRVSFGPHLDLVGLTLEASSGPGSRLVTFWEGEQVSQHRSHVFLALVDLTGDHGRVLRVQELTASAFVPQRIWRSEPLIQDKTLVFFPRRGGSFALGLMVGGEHAATKRAERLCPLIEQGSRAIELLDRERVLLLNSGSLSE